MRTLINGSQGLVKMAKGADEVLKVIVAKDKGASEDITGDSIAVLVYDRSDRANAAIATHSGFALTTPTAGLATVTIPDAEMTYGPGDFFAFVRWTDASATKVYLSAPFALVVR